MRSNEPSAVDPSQWKFFAGCSAGLENTLTRELQDFGVKEFQKLSRGVFFDASTAVALRVLIGSRSASFLNEVLVASKEPLRDRLDLTALVQEARDWPRVMSNEETLCVKADLATSDITPDLRNSHQSALTVCKAITDRCREVTGARPSVNLEAPDWMFHLLLHRDCTILYRRWSGRNGLHRRGYRLGVKIHKGAMRETTVAGLLKIAGLQEGEPISLLDPMCGSATFLVEAAMICARVAPGLLREAIIPGKWHSVPLEHAETLKNELFAASDRVQVPAGLRLIGTDREPRALALARKCVAQLQYAVPTVGNCIDLDVGSVTAAKLPESAVGVRQLVCCNPPWGVRLGGKDEEEVGFEEDPRDAKTSWSNLASFLKENSVEAWVATCNLELPQILELELGRKPTRRHTLDGGTRQVPGREKLASSTGVTWLRFGAPGEKGPARKQAPVAPED